MNIIESLTVSKLKFEKIFELITNQKFYINYIGNESYFDNNWIIDGKTFENVYRKYFYKKKEDSVINLISEQIFLNIKKLSIIDNTNNLSCKRILTLLLPLAIDDNLKKMEYYLKIKEKDFESICPFSAFKAKDRARAHDFIPIELIIENMELYCKDVILFYSLVFYENLDTLNETRQILENNFKIYNESYVKNFLINYIHPIFGRKIDEFSEKGEAIFFDYFKNILREKSYIFSFFKLRISFLNSYENYLCEDTVIEKLSLEEYINKYKYQIKK